jgi:hypothetical protein
MSALLDVMEETHEMAEPDRLRVSFDPELTVIGGLFIGEGDPIEAQTYLVPAHPLAPPTVSTTMYTVDLMLRQPTRITKMIMDLTLQRFVADRIYSSGGGVSGGSVIYDTVEANDIYTTRDVERVSPGAEFPIITSARRAPGVAEVEKWGGKVWIADEARDRNDSILFTNQLRQLSNTIVRKINARAIQVLEAMFTAFPARVIASTGNWGTATPYGGSPTAPVGWPAFDFAKAAEISETDELGINYDLWILNPQNYTQLLVLYGGDGLQELLDTLNIDIYVTNRMTFDSAYVVAQGQVGQMRVEQPLGTETWREPNRQRTWVQASVRPLMFVDNRFAALKFTALT